MAKRGPKRQYYFTQEERERGGRVQVRRPFKLSRDLAVAAGRKGGLETQRRKRERQKSN